MSQVSWQMTAVTNTAALRQSQKALQVRTVCLSCSLDFFHAFCNLGFCFRTKLAAGWGLLDPGLRTLLSRDKSPWLRMSVASGTCCRTGRLLSGERSLSKNTWTQPQGRAHFTLRIATLWRFKPARLSVGHHSTFTLGCSSGNHCPSFKVNGLSSGTSLKQGDLRQLRTRLFSL